MKVFASIFPHSPAFWLPSGAARGLADQRAATVTCSAFGDRVTFMPTATLRAKLG